MHSRMRENFSNNLIPSESWKRIEKFVEILLSDLGEFECICSLPVPTILHISIRQGSSEIIVEKFISILRESAILQFSFLMNSEIYFRHWFHNLIPLTWASLDILDSSDLHVSKSKNQYETWQVRLWVGMRERVRRKKKSETHVNTHILCIETFPHLWQLFVLWHASRLFGSHVIRLIPRKLFILRGIRDWQKTETKTLPTKSWQHRF